MPTPQGLAGKYFPYIDDFKADMEAGRFKKQYVGAPINTNDFANAGFNLLQGGLAGKSQQDMDKNMANLIERRGSQQDVNRHTVEQITNNPLLNMVMGQPLTFQDESGRVSIGPGGVFQAQQSKPGGWGGAINVPNRSVSLNKGMFDVSAGLGSTYMPDSTVRIGFDTRRMNAPQMVMPQTEGPLMQRQPSAGELERDQVIDQYKASDPFWYRVGTGVR